MLIRYLYTVFLSVLLATFVGVGIAAFYKGPIRPEYPISASIPLTADEKMTTTSAREREEQIKFEKLNREYISLEEIYNKNVSSIAVAASLLILAISIIYHKKILYLSDGILLGGVFTLIYAVIRGFNAGDEMFRFLVVSIGLAVAVFLGYWKFVKNIKNN